MMKTFFSRVWGEEVPAVDCGDEVATWLSKYIFKQDSGARLAYYPSQITSRSVKTKSVHPMMKEKDGVTQRNNPIFLKDRLTVPASLE